tara:strand:+ start:75 stop:227 length:153 start_codon:yes stop_codon:yes gene_type:complete
MPQNTIRKIAVIFVSDFVGFSKMKERNSVFEGLKRVGLKKTALRQKAALG